MPDVTIDGNRYVPAASGETAAAYEAQIRHLTVVAEKVSKARDAAESQVAALQEALKEKLHSAEISVRAAEHQAKELRSELAEVKAERDDIRAAFRSAGDRDGEALEKLRAELAAEKKSLAFARECHAAMADALRSERDAARAELERQGAVVEAARAWLRPADGSAAAQARADQRLADAVRALSSPSGDKSGPVRAWCPNCAYSTGGKCECVYDKSLPGSAGSDVAVSSQKRDVRTVEQPAEPAPIREEQAACYCGGVSLHDVACPVREAEPVPTPEESRACRRLAGLEQPATGGEEWFCAKCGGRAVATVPNPQCDGLPWRADGYRVADVLGTVVARCTLPSDAAFIVSLANAWHEAKRSQQAEQGGEGRS